MGFFATQNTKNSITTSAQRSNTVEQLVTIVNRGDRFKLLDDPRVPKGSLDNSIHPIFHHEHFLGRTPHIKQALQLASLFLTTPSLLEFYIPLSFGATRKKIVGATKVEYNTYIRRGSSTSRLEKKIIRAALKCLSHSHSWEWFDFKNSKQNNCGWACTSLIKGAKVRHTDQCPVFDDANETPFFKPNIRTHIKLDDGLLAYYLDEEQGYAKRSHCDQFRHDFQVAMVLGHEIAHAYGAIIRGSLSEQYLEEDHPKNELGYAWENFMFGGRIDPPKKTAHGTYIHLHKKWQNKEVLQKYWGFEYSVIPVAWTAQWFRKESWEEIQNFGPQAISLPISEFKIYCSLTMCRYIVYTDNEEVHKDFQRSQEDAGLEYMFCIGDSKGAESNTDLARAFTMPMTRLARRSLTPTPKRHCDDAVKDINIYLLNAQHRDFEAWEAMKAAKNKSIKTNIRHVGFKKKTSRKLVRSLRKSPVSDAEGQNSPADTTSDEDVRYMVEFLSEPPSSQPYSSTPSSCVHHLNKRSRDDDSCIEPLIPSKKFRREY